MSDKTLYVIGAGASKEANLPTGEELKSVIARMLDIRSKGNSSNLSGDGEFIMALQHRPKPTSDEANSFNDYRLEAVHISQAMPLAISIDNFIDSQRGNEKLEFCGKLAITLAILKAEAKSVLNLNHNDPNGLMNFTRLQESWYLPFFMLLTENCRAEDLPERFAKLTLIVFNYDRCIEHFLFYALQNYYRVTHEEAAKLMQNISIYHPYGKVGSLPWMRNNLNDSVEFGSVPSVSRVAELTGNIRTFSEGSEPDSSQINEIHKAVSESRRNVFLGFAFHPLNISLITPPNFPGHRGFVVQSFATALGISDSDHKMIERQMNKLAGSRVESNMVKAPCSHFFNEYWRSLSFV